MEKELQDTIRIGMIDDLKKEAWRKCANAAYDETKIPEVKMLQDKKLAELNGDGGLKDQLKAIDEAISNGNHTKETRMEKKRKEYEITQAESFILSCDEVIQSINKGANDARSTAAQHLARAKFMETYDFVEPVVPNAEGITSMQAEEMPNEMKQGIEKATGVDMGVEPAEEKKEAAAPAEEAQQ